MAPQSRRNLGLAYRARFRRAGLALWLSALVAGCPVRQTAQRKPPRPGPPPAVGPMVVPALGSPPFGIVVHAGGDPVGREVVRVLRRDLLLSGLFLPSARAIDRAGLHLPGQLPAARPATRVEVGAAAHTTEIAIEATVYFAASGMQTPAGTIRLHAPDVRRAAHRLGNEIYRLHTDTPGPFLSRIAFVAPRAGDPTSQHVFVVDFDGAAPLRISGMGRHNILPAWSARGDLAFTSFARGNPDLYLVSAGSHRMRPVSTRAGLNTGAAFSPDGRVIALTLTEHGNQDIYLIGLDGSIRRRLTYHPKIDVSPTWSPDGRSVALVSERGRLPQIFVLSLAGGMPREVTRDGGDNQEPEWCLRPGSSEIAYTSRRHGTYQIFVVDARTAQSRQLTFGPADKQSPTWSPDCRLLAYSASDGLWTVTARGDRTWHLYRGTANTPAWSR